MLKICKSVLFIICISLNSYAFSSENKIVFLNLDSIVQNSNAGKAILIEFESKKKKNIKNFKTKENELLSKEKDIINKKNILSKEEFEVKALALNEEMKIYNNEKKNFFLQYENNKKNELNLFLKKITPLIENYVKENSITIVLNKKDLFIAHKKFDITEQIIEIVNKNIK